MISLLRKFFKTFFLCVCYCVAFFLPKSSKPIVLMYHSVGGFNFKHSISKEIFTKHVQFLVEKYNIVPLEDIVFWIQGKKKLPEKSVALTFDDGYKDNQEVLFPLLKKYNIPATVFLTTNLNKLKKLAYLPRLTEEEIDLLAGSGLVSIEAHGHNHFNLTDLDITDAENEITMSKDQIKEMTGRSPRFFAYPFGYRNSAVQSLVIKHFEAGFGIGEGRVSLGDNIYAIKRVQVDNTVSFFEFRLRLTKAIDINRFIIDYVRKKLLWKK